MTFRLLRAAILSLSLLACVSASAPPVEPARPMLAHYLPEVRLRKLHLVRPDLIGYPLYFEVLC